MKDVRYDVSQYDAEVTIALGTINSRLQSTKNHESNAEE